jgi:hypothetical protein
MTSPGGKRRRRAESHLRRAKAMADTKPKNANSALPPGAVAADPAQLTHNNTYSELPRFYVDKAIQCRQCGKEEVWTANRQKWWYEVAKGNIFSQAVLCRACREEGREKKAEARRVHLEGVARKRGRTKT